MGNYSSFEGSLSLSKQLSNKGLEKIEALRSGVKKSLLAEQESKKLNLYSTSLNWLCDGLELTMPIYDVKAYNWVNNLKHIIDNILTLEQIYVTGDVERIGEYSEIVKLSVFENVITVYEGKSHTSVTWTEVKKDDYRA